MSSANRTSCHSGAPGRPSRLAGRRSLAGGASSFSAAIASRSARRPPAARRPRSSVSRFARAVMTFPARLGGTVEHLGQAGGAGLPGVLQRLGQRLRVGRGNDGTIRPHCAGLTRPSGATIAASSPAAVWRACSRRARPPRRLVPAPARRSPCGRGPARRTSAGLRRRGWRQAAGGSRPTSSRRAATRARAVVSRSSPASTGPKPSSAIPDRDAASVRSPRQPGFRALWRPARR